MELENEVKQLKEQMAKSEEKYILLEDEKNMYEDLVKEAEQSQAAVQTQLEDLKERLLNQVLYIIFGKVKWPIQVFLEFFMTFNMNKKQLTFVENGGNDNQI